MRSFRVITYDNSKNTFRTTGLQEHMMKYPLFLIDRYNIISNNVNQDILHSIQKYHNAYIVKYPFDIPSTSNWLIQNKVLIGDQPDPSRNVPELLVKIGVTTFVNFYTTEESVSEGFISYREQAENASYQPLEFISFHIKDDDAINDNIPDFLKQLVTRIENLEFGNSIYIHCSDTRRRIDIYSLLYGLVTKSNRDDSLKHVKSIYESRNKTVKYPQPDTLEVVDFYSCLDNEWRPFSNFIGEITYEGKKWPTVEHAFHANKFRLGDNKGEDLEQYKEYIRVASTPAKAKALGNQEKVRDYGGTVLLNPEGYRIDINEIISEYKKKIIFRKDWDKVKDNIMFDLVTAKINQNEAIRDILLSTGNRVIREVSPSDNYWGVGKNKNGKNMLGIILMKVRDKILGVLRDDKYYHDITKSSYTSHPVPDYSFNRRLGGWNPKKVPKKT